MTNWPKYKLDLIFSQPDSIKHWVEPIFTILINNIVIMSLSNIICPELEKKNIWVWIKREKKYEKLVIHELNHQVNKVI